jgi:hypothetical protein
MAMTASDVADLYSSSSSSSSFYRHQMKNSIQNYPTNHRYQYLSNCYSSRPMMLMHVGRVSLVVPELRFIIEQTPHTHLLFLFFDRLPS